jgi:hypothetical protein
MLNFINSRIRFAAQYATRKQLTKALIGDSAILAAMIFFSTLLFAQRIVAFPFELIALVEVVSVSLTAYLLITRKNF